MGPWCAPRGWRRCVAFGTGLIVAVSFCLRSWAEPDWRPRSLSEFELFDDTGAEDEASFHKRFCRALRTELSDINAARAIYDELLEERPGTAYLYYKLAHLDAREQNFDASVDNFRKALEHDPKLRVAYDDLERLYSFWRRDQDLVELWEQAIEHIKPDNIAYYLKLGEQHEAHDRLDEAVAVYERAIAEHPVLYQPWLKLFELQLGQGRKDEADDTFRKSLEATGGHRALLVGVRDAYRRANVPERTFELERLLVDRFPAVADFWLDLIAALLERAEVGQALAAFKKSCAYVGKEPGYFAKAVRVFTRQADMDAAVAALEYALEWGSDAPEVLVALALLYQAQGRMDKAQPLYDRLLESGVQNEALLLSIAEGYETRGDLEEFGQWAGRAMAARPESVEARFAMLRYLERSGKTKEARALLDELLADLLGGEEPNPAPLVLIGRFYLSQEEYNLAREIAGKGLDNTGHRELVRQFYFISGLADYVQDRIPDAARKLRIASRREGEIPVAHFYCGMANLRLDKADAAVEALKKAVEADPGDAFWRLKLGQAIKLAGRSEEAASVFDAAIDTLSERVEAEPDSAKARIGLAVGLSEIGRTKDAFRVYREAIGLDPKSATPLNNLAYLMADEGVELDEALKLINQALELEPEIGTFIDTLGWVYYKQGKYEDALRELERAVEKGPASGEIYDHVGDAHLKLGDKAKAIEWWNKALELYPENAADIRQKVVDQGGTPSVEPSTE